MTRDEYIAQRLPDEGAKRCFGDLLDAEQQYERACMQYAIETREWIALDDALGRVRRDCGRAIQKEHIETSGIGAKPIADTPLDKLAGDHPTYVAHRERLSTAAQNKEMADAERRICEARLVLARQLFMIAAGLTTA